MSYVGNLAWPISLDKEKSLKKLWTYKNLIERSQTILFNHDIYVRKKKAINQKVKKHW